MIEDCRADARGRNWWARKFLNSWIVFCNGAAVADYRSEAAALKRVKRETEKPFEEIQFDPY